jgi:hypothetical protein
MVLCLLTGSMTGYAQSAYFEYEDANNTIINGLTTTGLAASSLTVPATVTTVKSGTFSSNSAKVSTLIIEAGGNPVFASGLFGERENPLGDIQILGSSMTVANITALLASLGSQGALNTVYIAGYSGEWSDITETSVLTADVDVILPAALVSTQQFGNAKVKGRFTINKEIITFCGNATFQDTDDGSNMLFYIADECNKETGYIHIDRVRYVAKGEGVLIHNLENTSTYADLPRYDGIITGEVQTLYNSNMLKGVTAPRSIGKTDGDKTNLVLSNGAFHPTSGGIIGANKAYLQVPTSMLAHEMLSIDFSDETTSLSEKGKVNSEKFATAVDWYSLDGRKVNGSPSTKGLYIVNGRIVVVK